MILQAEEAEDWVIATGKTTTVRDFVLMSFREVGIELEFKGEGVNEKGFIASVDKDKYEQAIGASLRVPDQSDDISKILLPTIGKEVLSIDPRYFRPTEVELLIGDPTKAQIKLGWECKYNLQDLIKEMMKSDLKLMQKDQYLKDGGYTTL